MSTNIEWTHTINNDGSISKGETWNPFAGCSKISAGCKNCYAIRDAVRLAENNNPKIAEKYAGTVSGNNWTGKINLAPEDTLLKPLRWTRPRMIFVNSMSDLFHENVLDEWIDKVFAIMALSPNHTFQILTKRPERMKDYLSKKLDEFSDFGISETIKFTDLEGLIFDYIYENGSLKSHLKDAGWFYDTDYYEGGSEPGDLIYEAENPLHNVWLGVSIEDQKTADERIPLLLETPAAVRWLSVEPILENINLPIYYCCNCFKFTQTERVNNNKDWGCTICGCYKTNGWKPSKTQGISWCVVGGESGDKARVCNVEWIRSIVQQCKAANVPVFVKQLGSVPIGKKSDQFYMFNHGATLLDAYEKGASKLILSHKKGGDIDQFPGDLRVREYPKGVV